MIDIFAILASCFCVVYVVVRAAKLDAVTPWFGEDSRRQIRGKPKGNPPRSRIS
ncbi:hypothetical protein [Magnetospirillum molischianum]|uniref:hypothetical protein n=1 Tax=Magnetospirillum molischianum TaxID=1083 RepID=UPI0002E8B77B|nr:hypothetical protein [Magnetospirillum molischianum]